MLSVVILLRDYKDYDLTKNIRECIKYARMLAEREHKGGMYDYSKLVLDYDGNEKGDEENEYYPSDEEEAFAVEACRKSAEMENTDAMALYAKCLLYGTAIEKDEEAALKWVLKSFEDEDEASDEGYVLYGKMLNEGKVVPNTSNTDIEEVPLDQDEAVYYSRRGAERGEGHCMYYYGLFLFDGNGVEQDREEAIFNKYWK